MTLIQDLTPNHVTEIWYPAINATCDEGMSLPTPAMDFSYDPASQVTNILHQITASSTQINKADYVYNPVGIEPPSQIGAARCGRIVAHGCRSVSDFSAAGLSNSEGDGGCAVLIAAGVGLALC